LLRRDTPKSGDFGYRECDSCLLIDGKQRRIDLSAPNHQLRCLNCSAAQAPSARDLYCALCGGLFAVEYLDPPDGAAPRLPMDDRSMANSLGEGDTPLVSLERTAGELRLGSLWAKLEFMAPTGSFKDRGSAILTTMGRDLGVTEFVEDSSGNAGASLSAYAASAGIKAHVFAPASAARGKLDQIQVFAANLHKIEGPRQAATDAAEAFVADRELVYMSHNLSPYFSEGMKAASYELVAVLGDKVEHMVLPVGNGSLLIGMVRGYQELLEAGIIGQIPKFHGVQAHAVRPVVAALNGEVWSHEDIRPTQASGIAVSKPPRLAEMVEAIQSTSGAGVTVAETSLTTWQKRLASSEGIFAEMTSAVALAGLEKLIDTGTIERGATVCVPITGSGLKEPLS